MIGLGPGKQQNKFFTAVTGADITGADACGKDFCNPLKHLITSQMAVGVIDELELVHVQNN
ncbi:hypothetical protein D3C80_2041080 [compost metagenome]